MADRRHKHAGRARHRLDDHRGDRLGTVQVDAPLEIVGQLGAMLRKAAREGVAFDVVRVAEMVDARQPAAEGAPTVDEAADADPAEPGAMLAARPPANPRPRPPPLPPPNHPTGLPRP